MVSGFGGGGGVEVDEVERRGELASVECFFGHRFFASRSLFGKRGFSLFCFCNLTDGTSRLLCVAHGVEKREGEREKEGVMETKTNFCLFDPMALLSSQTRRKKSEERKKSIKKINLD